MVLKKVLITLMVVVLVVITAFKAPIVSMKMFHLDEEERNGAELSISLERLMAEYYYNIKLADWNHQINITEETTAQKSKVELDYVKAKNNILTLMQKLDWKKFRDPDLINYFEHYLGIDPVRVTISASFDDVITKMISIYSTTQICDYKNKTKCDLNLEPEIEEIFQKSQDSEELKHTWVEWHQKVGRKSKNLFKEYVKLRKELFPTAFNQTDPWLRSYQDSGIEKQLNDLWLKIRPLYLQIHAFVRKQLYNKYGPAIINRRGPIPAHLLGNMCGESSYIKPYPNKPDMNITPVMLKKNFTALKMFQMADEFFQSINLSAVPMNFWKNSVFTKPNDDHKMVCHPSAWEINNGDYRVKLCTIVNEKYFETIHHEMGHIQYFMQYSQQPLEYHQGSNPGFHEAIGDLIALSATSSKHLRKIGLLEGDYDDYESKINELFRKGIEKIAVIPFTYLLDPYRFVLFKGQIAPENHNCYFWKLKEKYQGVEPPERRTEEDCDAVVKFHVASDNPYTHHFVGHVIQFQFHKTLCKIAGEYEEGNVNKKLSDCDIYQSTEAGNALGDMMKLGSSVHWKDALEQLTSENAMNASSLLEYFEPLMIWLKGENERTGELIGWDKSNIEFCTEEQEAELLL